MNERWLVTGALGCIGSWVVRVLAEEGADVTTLDLDTDGQRLELVVGRELLSGVRCLKGDIADLDSVCSAIRACAATHIVHLAALQIPFCKAEPSLGARVNVVGTVNVFEAAVHADTRVRGLSYASSAAAYDALETGSAGDFGELPGKASTLYGVYKRANEGVAQVYWADAGLASIGLRPHTVYGPGRDQGWTSQPTLAMKAAASGEAFHIAFGGQVCMQYARDVASDFVEAARAATSESHVVNVQGTVVSVQEIIEAIESAVPEAAGSITFENKPLPFPADLIIDATAFKGHPMTPLREGVDASIRRFREAAHT